MKMMIILLVLLVCIHPISASITIEFSNLNVSNYNVEIYAPNKSLLQDVSFNEIFTLDATDDYIIQIKPAIPEVLNSTNLVAYTEDKLDMLTSLVWFFAFLAFFIVTILFFRYLLPTS